MLIETKESCKNFFNYIFENERERNEQIFVKKDNDDKFRLMEIPET